MKVAIVYNRQNKNVINLFGQLNKEKIGKKTIRRILNALKTGKHQAIALEGDKELVPHLEEFMPRVLKGERPGIVRHDPAHAGHHLVHRVGGEFEILVEGYVVAH